MRLLAVADLHYSLPQFDWVLEVAPDFDVVVLAGDLLEHVVEETDPGRDVVRAGAVEIDRHRNAGLGGVAGDGGLSHRRASIARALTHAT